MTRRRRLFLGALLLVVSAAIAVVTAGLYVLRSAWLANTLRHRAIAAIESATGGRAELGSFRYDWRALTLEFDDLVLHGTEPSGAPPLFRAEAVRIQLKIGSLWKRDIDITSLAVERPRVYLLFRPDGSTNIPNAKAHHTKTAVEQLIDLKIGHFAIDQGEVQTEFRQIPLSARGENLNAVLTYEAAAERYGVQLSSHQVHIESNQTLPVAPDLQLQANLERNRLNITQFNLQTSKSQISGNLVLTNFRNPVADMQVKVKANTSEVGKVSEVPELSEGDIEIAGTAHYDVSSAFAFHGRMSARDVGYRSRFFSLRHISAQSDIYVDERDIDLSRLTASVLGSGVVGSASLKDFRRLTVAGDIHRLDLREVAPYLTAQAVPWRGTVEGPFRIEGMLGRRLRGFVLHTDAAISPVSEGIPLSGKVDVTYRQATHVIELGPSEFILPSSRLAVSGVPGQDLTVTLDSRNLNELRPALPILGLGPANMALPISLNKNGSVHFAGTVAGLLPDSRIDGDFALARFESQGEAWDQLHGHLGLTSRMAQITGLVLDQGSMHASGSGLIPLAGWTIDRHSPFHLDGQFRGADVVHLLDQFSTLKLPIVRGVASGSGTIAGTIENPSGNAKIGVDSLDAYGELLNRIQFSAALRGDDLQIASGKIQAGPASASFSAEYRHAKGSWDDGTAQLKLDSNGFPLASVSLVHKYEPELNAQFEVHGQAAFRIVRDQFQPLKADGTLSFRHVTLRGISFGGATVSAVTQGQVIEAKIAGDLRTTQLNGSARIQIAEGYPAQGALHLGRIDLGTIYTLAGRSRPLPFNGSLRGDILLDGPLLDPNRFKGSLRIDDIQVNPILPAVAKRTLNSGDLTLRNMAPIVVEVANGSALVRGFEIGGKDTSISVTGSIPLTAAKTMDLHADGSVNLKIFQLADPNVLSTGVSTIDATFGGTYREPTANGRLELKNASFFLNNVPNGLSDVNGTLRFDGNRATIEKLIAHSGGGDLSMAGFVSFGTGPLVYQLTGTANQVRVRYTGGISATANSSLRFSGTSDASVLSGSVTVTKASFNPSTDIGALLAKTAAPVPAPSNEKGFLEGAQFDVRVESSPSLQLSTYLSQDVQAEVDMRLRGTPDHPTVLGSISVNEGDIKIFGTTYTINRGEINFQNPARIEPVLDLDLLTEAGGIAVDITVSGPLSKLNINYRSDPPLQPRDIVALLTVGRTPDISSNLSSSQTTNDYSALQSGANTVLGQAFAPVSNRLSKLFGITNIKIDPLVQGITNTPQARLTVQQQISKSITVTYITNLQQTSEQIFRLEWAFSSQYSLVALRDDNGEFGIDILFKKRFK
ncbi:MAG TPA: translocation/assembly module TamB domain-containing protein [Bryobacteraceae bacterium]|nr:translocation/assembly module TamB domain-containing protein [Bryobacteraceae bacterium]